MIHILSQKYDIVTPERSVPSSPTLSPATVTHTIAMTEKNAGQLIDISELSKLLKRPTNENTRRRSQLIQSSKPPSPTLSTCSAEATFINSNAAAPILSQHQSRPQLQHRPASTCSTPSQFVFKKPEYNENYHQTHFHRNNTNDSFAWSDLRRFFGQENVIPSTNSNAFANQFKQNIGDKYGTWGKT